MIYGRKLFIAYFSNLRNGWWLPSA